MPAATPKRGLHQLMGDADRIAVIDVETTGLYNKDRVVEIAIVTLDSDGTVTDEFNTLINPSRDVGPTWLHHITPSMVSSAPTFDQIVGHIAARLHGAICVGHNLKFDARMVGGEFQRAGVEIDWGLGLDTLAVTGCKLGQACDEHGVHLDNAHRALGDARATADLLVAVAHYFNQESRAAQAHPIRLAPIRICTRDGLSNADVPTPYLAQLAAGLHTQPDIAPYVALLDAALADLALTHDERDELASLATELGLDDHQIRLAHRAFLDGLVDAALDDKVVSDEEIDQLCRAAALLDLDLNLVTQRTDTFRTAFDSVYLESGLGVCFTGSAVDESGNSIDRTELESLAASHGLIPRSSVTAKGCQLLVAADTASRSGKVEQARRFGIPIASVSDFLVAIRTNNPLNVLRIEAIGVALVCVRCGHSWVGKRRKQEPLCASCTT